jgi:hypothetical protein
MTIERRLGCTEECPGRNVEHCPSPFATAAKGQPLMLRLDVDGQMMASCACLGPENAPDRRRRATTAPGGLPLVAPYFQDIRPSFSHLGSYEWSAMESLFAEPEEGMAALGLAILPESLQELITDALGEHRRIALRLNLDVESLAEVEFALRCIRALARTAGIRLEVAGTRLTYPDPGRPPEARALDRIAASLDAIVRCVPEPDGPRWIPTA